MPTIGPGTGTVTSVALSATMPTGLTASISGSPVTSTGTLALTLTFSAGYSIPTTTKQGQWDSAYTFVSAFPFGTTGQLVRFTSLGNLEAFTPDYLGNVMTSLGDMIYGNAVGLPVRRSGNITTTKMFLSQTGDGSVSAAPQWSAVTAADVGGVPTSRTLTINDVSFDLSANRSYSVGDYGTW